MSALISETNGNPNIGLLRDRALMGTQTRKGRIIKT